MFAVVIDKNVHLCLDLCISVSTHDNFFLSVCSFAYYLQLYFHSASQK